LPTDRQPDTLGRLRDALMRHRGLAALVFAILLVLLGTAALSLPPLYRATAVLVVEPTRTGADLPGEILTRLETIEERLRSRAEILERARRFQLYPELFARSLETAIVEQMRSDIRITTRASADPGGRGPVVAVSLSYRGRDPRTAARVCNDLAEFYVEEANRLRSQRYLGRAEILKQRLDEMKERLSAQERSLGGPRLPAGDGREEADADAATFERLSSRLRIVRDERLHVLERRESLLRQISDVDPRGAASARLTRLRQELVEKRRRFTDKHPDVLQLEAEIAALDEESAARPAPVAEPSAAAHLRDELREVEAALVPMKAEEARLSRELAASQRRLDGAGAPRAGADATRDYRAAQEMYGALLRRYEDAQLADSAEEALGSRLALLDPAVPPARSGSPKRGRLLAVALLAAIAAAFVAAAIAERLDDSFRSVDELRAFTAVPVLTTVSALWTPEDRRRRRRRLGAAWALAAAGLILTAGCTRHVTAESWALTSALERGQ
jgi:uncharacterized protein involved in exopolysaccharide biosynthesis